MRNPADFKKDSFRRKNIKTGIDIIIGRLKGKTTTTTQAFRFKTNKFTSAQAKKWLKIHDIKYISFEAAVKKEMIMDNDIIEKATADDIKRYLREAIKEKFNIGGSWTYVMDYDDTYAYFESESHTNGVYKNTSYRVSYTLNGVDITLGDDKEKVIRETTYTPVKEESISKSLLSGMKDLFKEYFGDKEKIDEKESHFIEKFQEEKMIAYEPLYAAPDIADGDKEGMSESEIIKMVDIIKGKIDEGTMQANLFHKVPTQAFEWVDAFVSPWPICTVGTQEVAKGQPVAVCKYNNKKAWELRKQGIIKGPSIEGTAGKKRSVDNGS